MKESFRSPSRYPESTADLSVGLPLDIVSYEHATVRGWHTSGRALEIDSGSEQRRCIGWHVRVEL